MKTKLFTLLFALLSATGLFAEKTEIGALYYNLYWDGIYCARVTGCISDHPTTIVIPKFVTYENKSYRVVSIGDYAFRSCTDLTSVTIGNSVTSIGRDAFYGCTGLTSVTIGNSVTSIGSGAFRDCTGLTSVTIGNSVTSIGDGAFVSCTGLTSVTIGNSVTSIGSGAFRDCTGLTSVTIGNSVTSIGSGAFRDCTGLTSVTWNVKQCDTFSYSTLFSNCPEITAFTFGNEVESIPSDLCSEMDKLTSVTIGNSVTSIGRDAFYGCTGLTKTNYTGDIAGWCKIEFDGYASNPIYYSHNLYINDVEVQDLVIPNSVTSIGRDAFYGCTGLTSVTIGNSVTSIGYRAFRDCTGLTSVTIPNSVTSIGYWAFYNCTGLTSVTIGNSVTSIENDTFSNCTGLTSVTIGNSVTSIGERAFSNCTGLTSVTIDNSVASIGSNAFAGCTGLTSVTIGNSVRTIGYRAFASCTGLTSVTIPNSVTSIGGDTFSNCTGLTSVTIGNSVTSIEYRDFASCTGLTSVTIGNSVTTIGDYAFYNCTALLTMEVKAALPPMIQSNTFTDVSTTVMLTVPCESQNYYKAAQYWNQFTNWQEAVLSFSAVTEDATKGKVSVTQKPTCDDPTAVIKAVPAGGYRFKEWSDGNTENPRTVWVDEEMDLVAYFAAEGDGVENIVVIEGVSMAGNRLCIAGHEEENMNLYSATGAQLYAGQVRDITLPNAGVYLVQIGTAVQKLIVP